MAKRARSKSVGKRRYKKAKAAYVAPITRFGGSKVAGIPTGMRMEMKYCARIGLKSAIVNISENVFRAFSIYDPDLSGVGHQPLGHDQWQQFYRRYRVLGSKIQVDFDNMSSPTAGAETEPQQVVLALTEGSTVFASAEDLGEQPVSKMSSCTFNGSPVRLSLPYNTNWMTKGDLGGKYDDDSSAVFGANPGRDGFYHIIAQQGGSATVSAKALVTITYTVWVFDPVDLAQS